MGKSYFNPLVVSLCATMYLSTGGVSLFADPTGDPSADLWTAEGASASVGNYIDGAASYNVTLYSTAFTLSSSSSLISTLGGYDWNAGDTIVGVGGVFGGANADLTFSGGADEHNVSHTGSTSTRIVIKYGTSAATWTTPGTGSLANGGTGSILLGTYAYDLYPANSGTFIVPTDSPEEQTGVSSTAAISGYMGRVIADWNGSTLVGFESLLDLTLLDATYPDNGVALGNKFVLDLQHGSSNYQDSLGTLPTTVPEPTSIACTLFGLAALAGYQRWKK